ncbi:hypothetical protein Tco_1008534 [Tanacetum coccineum]
MKHYERNDNQHPPNMLEGWLTEELQQDDIHIIKETLDDMMRERRKTTKEYAYHTEQATIYLNNQIVWENREGDLIPQVLEKEAPVFYDPQRNPNKPLMFLWNKDLFYLNNGNTKAKKYVLSLHKIHATIFPKDDLKELLARYVGKVFKRFNEEARLFIQHWKQP